MANVPRIKTAVLLLLAGLCLFFLLLAWQATAGSEPHTIYLPQIYNGERETGGLDPIPRVTLTPTPEASQ